MKLNTLEDLNKVNLNDFNSVTIFYYSDVVWVHFEGTRLRNMIIPDCPNTFFDGFILRCRLQNINVSELSVTIRLLPESISDIKGEIE